MSYSLHTFIVTILICIPECFCTSDSFNETWIYSQLEPHLFFLACCSFYLSNCHGYIVECWSHTILHFLKTDYRSSSGGGTVILDDCNFHESVHLDSFDIDRTLTLVSTQIRLFCLFVYVFAELEHYISSLSLPPFQIISHSAFLRYSFCYDLTVQCNLIALRARF